MEVTPRKPRNKLLKNVSQMGTPIKIPPSPMLKNLGYGTGVNVFMLERSPKLGMIRSPWAIKRISRAGRTSDATLGYQKRLRAEAEYLRKLSHPNIVGFRGFSVGKDGQQSLVLECCGISLGNILENRCDAKLGPLENTSILKMCADIVKALDYLHNNASILHGDIKSGNILVKGDFEICKLCDFGVSLRLNKSMEVDTSSDPSLEYIGTELWSAPEVFSNGIITDRADMWSFGLVVYETIALIPPHTLGMFNDDDSVDEEEFAVGTRPHLPESSLTEDYNRVLEIFFICTQECAEDRPSARALNLALNSYT